MQSVEYRKATKPEKDTNGKVIDRFVFVDGMQVGHLARAQFGPGFFLLLYGSKWQNAPGARYVTELSARTDYTYVKTLKEATARVLANLKQTT